MIKNLDSSSFSHVTRVFACKQIVISFGVLFVLSVLSFLSVVDICLLTVCEENSCHCDQSKLLPEQMFVRLS